MAHAAEGHSGRWPQRMNATEALSWFMDKIPDFRSVAGVLVILRGSPSLPALRRDLERLAARLPRFRQRVCEVPLGLGTPEWVDAGAFDVGTHLRQVTVPAPGGIEELLAEIGSLYETPLDAGRPLWEAFLAEGLAGRRGAVFLKMHHCMIGGAAGARLLGELLAADRDRRPETSLDDGESRSTASVALLARALRDGVVGAADFGGSMARGLSRGLTHPRSTASAAVGAFRAVRGIAREVAASRGENPLGASRSLSRHLATFEMRSDRIDRLRERLGASAGELLLAVVGGALQRWCRVEGIEIDALRAAVPFAVPGEAHAGAGSGLAPLSIALPVSPSSMLRRLRAVQERVEAVKADGRASLYPWFARVALGMPIPLAEVLAHRQNKRASLVCSIMPGPPGVCALGGQTVERIYPYLPLCGDQPLGISALEYRGTLCVGIDVDGVAVGKLGRLRSDLEESYKELLKIGSSKAGVQRRRSRPLGRRAVT